ncbi:hypothetical protein JW905_00495, partial [bacterium]|nr:hypothetical protein [candidate division CSSED10-310 bacterium]
WGRTRNLVMIVVVRWLSIFHGNQTRRSFQWGRTRNLAMFVVERCFSRTYEWIFGVVPGILYFSMRSVDT